MKGEVLQDWIKQEYVKIGELLDQFGLKTN